MKKEENGHPMRSYTLILSVLKSIGYFCPDRVNCHGILRKVTVLRRAVGSKIIAQRR